ncbi:hypothetical protein H920_15074 [Fukomys damarensis]|uniref:Uncharacterized protein n=1 Tax=Fukomys damarensis TaxID=885580 RepID=A0A091CXP5_FUKDA|nr:hypothetical protein H920_15074 [Fukomys damarensis]
MIPRVENPSWRCNVRRPERADARTTETGSALRDSEQSRRGQRPWSCALLKSDSPVGALSSETRCPRALERCHDPGEREAGGPGFGGKGKVENKVMRELDPATPPETRTSTMHPGQGQPTRKVDTKAPPSACGKVCGCHVTR